MIILILSLKAGAFAFAGPAEDSVTSWKEWKSIEAAIVLRPLDGPDDIIEKAEIIEDRLDELLQEKVRLETEANLSGQELQSLRNQREVLQELAELKTGGDSQTRKRLNDLAGRIRRQETEVAILRKSLDELEEECIRMKDLAQNYREKALSLSIKEGGIQ